ncbi:MAG: C39 family peptidase [Streptococcus sp.]|jgi:pneumococcal surface protein A|nr:C39 family peptidase [Streptococcus sp.]
MFKRKRFKIFLVLLLLVTHFSTRLIYAQEEGWVKSGERWWYRYSDGGYPANEWLQVNGVWYHFDDEGWMETGWIKYSNKWYYLNESGAMRTSYLYTGDAEYYFHSDGDMYWMKLIVEWQKQENTNWCWLASATMAGNYIRDYQLTQVEVGKYVLNTSEPPNVAGWPWDISKAMEYYTNYSAGWTIIPENSSQLIDRIDAKKPFVLSVLWPTMIHLLGSEFDIGGFSGHSVCVVGYNLETREMIYYDPGLGSYKNSFISMDEIDSRAVYKQKSYLTMNYNQKGLYATLNFYNY